METKKKRKKILPPLCDPMKRYPVEMNWSEKLLVSNKHITLSLENGINCFTIVTILSLCDGLMEAESGSIFYLEINWNYFSKPSTIYLHFSGINKGGGLYTYFVMRSVINSKLKAWGVSHFHILILNFRFGRKKPIIGNVSILLEMYIFYAGICID